MGSLHAAPDKSATLILAAVEGLQGSKLHDIIIIAPLHHLGHSVKVRVRTMAYIAPIHRPTSVRHALKIRFLSPDEDSLVVA